MSLIKAQRQRLRAIGRLLQRLIFYRQTGEPEYLNDLDRRGVCNKGGNLSNLVFYKLLRYAIPNLLNST
ncbi:hypothetical protein [Thermocoleostomius sinensis]|uniref:Uncharacterized protein n=1 Tax=Thermocoleostomius sinensis A174 TaxID=2016057 RepID=A0A9E8ZDS1_9CYAN|nr:hypothetical protein [Thermocoleostomius sinensis]WAL61318.1 hypothetical protein OXH18_04790 [Thermocoleostomius sinensis A174]